MPSPALFNYIDRGHARTLALLPGWATDAHVFDMVDLPFNYLICTTPIHEVTINDLAQELSRYDLRRISLLGFSMGAYFSQRFYGVYGGLVEVMILVGARSAYPQREIEGVSRLLQKNKAAFLTGFYNNCFRHHPAPDDKQALIHHWVTQTSPETLKRGLTQLALQQLDVTLLKTCNRLLFVHGAHDVIAPLEGLQYLCQGLPNAEILVLAEEAHLPLFSPECNRLIRDWIEKGDRP